MNKHAYLIIAHSQFELLEKIIRLLDDERHDFYIHVDLKSEGLDQEKFRGLPRYSKVEFVPSVSVTWGGYSLVQAELNLLKAAVKEKYAYYHLISGVDLPLKKAEEIYRFFEDRSGKEFIHFAGDEFTFSTAVQERVKLYHFLQELVGNKRSFFFFVQKISLRIQRYLRVNRFKDAGMPIMCGSQWFSATDAFVQYLLSKESFINKYFGNGFCADELFVQTLFNVSPFKENLYQPAEKSSCPSNMRLIDWKRGNPYVFRSENFDELMQSEAMFARKFDLNVDKNICERIYDDLKS